MSAMTLAAAAPPATTGSAPPELGSINWKRGFDSAAAVAKARNKPLLVLFQEVPGCSTCVNYGADVLSHPLIKDAAESHFVPVAVYNNIKGDDERTLKLFKEPSWNNPVVRVMTAERKQLVPRLAGDYTAGGLAVAMVDGLRQMKAPVPDYLDLFAQEGVARKRGVKRATFAMHCFWEGEVALGAMPGVVSTLAGFVNGEEIVEVEYDPKRITFVNLLKRAQAAKCASRVYTRSDAQHSEAGQQVGKLAVRSDDAARPDKQPKYYLSRTPYRFVPMTGLQAARVNAAIRTKADPKSFLSPSQLKLLKLIEKHPKAKWPVAFEAKDLAKAWRAASAIAIKVASR